MNHEQELRNAIKNTLATVTEANSPTIYQLIQTEQGYKFVEEKLIEKVCKNNLTVSACIPHLENEL